MRYDATGIRMIVVSWKKKGYHTYSPSGQQST